MQVLQHQHGGAVGHQPGHQRLEGGKRGPLEVLRCPGQGWPQVRRPGPHDLGHQVKLVVWQFPSEYRLHGPLQGRPLWPCCVFGGDAHPGRQQLLVQAVGGGRSVRCGAALQPERQAPRGGPDPGHEQLAALVDQAGLAQAGLPRHEHYASLAGGGVADGVPKIGQLGLAAHQRRPSGQRPAAGLARRAGLGPFQVGGCEGLSPRRCDHVLGRPPLEEALGGGPGGRPDQDRARSGHRLQGGGCPHHLA